jgi:hypothetical protein
MKKLFMAILGSVLLAGASAQAAEYGVQVECYSDSGCNSIWLSDVCGSGKNPVSISCSQVKTPTNTTSCSPGTCGSPMQIGNGSIAKVGDFCLDVNGYDAIVICHSAN